jgi:predicted O-methyltransferase YrrM
LNFFSLFKRQILYKLKKKINIDKEKIHRKNLDQLFQYYKCDKSNKGHGFSKIYSKFLKNLKKKKLNILEIGSYAGASAAAFNKYLPRSRIYCFDINISNFKYYSKNINVYGVNINNLKKVEKTIIEIKKINKFKMFDIIIDDGSHYLSDIIFTLKNLFKNLKPKGLYVIEDFKHPNYYSYNKDVNHILIDKMLKNISKKKIFNSKILDRDNQLYLHKSIKSINTYKGKLKDSDICFIKKK